MVRVKPFGQGSADVQRDADILEWFEDVQERPVAILIRLLKDMIEIANGLMIVQCEAESELIGHGSLRMIFG